MLSWAKTSGRGRERAEPKNEWEIGAEGAEINASELRFKTEEPSTISMQHIIW